MFSNASKNQTVCESVCLCVQVIHALLDLPCLSAALELARQGGGSVGGAVDPGAVTVTALSDPRYKPLFKFILRNQSGSGDTIDRFDPSLHFLFVYLCP